MIGKGLLNSIDAHVRGASGRVFGIVHTIRTKPWRSAFIAILSVTCLVSILLQAESYRTNHLGEMMVDRIGDAPQSVSVITDDTVLISSNKTATTTTTTTTSTVIAGTPQPTQTNVTSPESDEIDDDGEDGGKDRSRRRKKRSVDTETNVKLIPRATTNNFDPYTSPLVITVVEPDEDEDSLAPASKPSPSSSSLPTAVSPSPAPMNLASTTTQNNSSTGQIFQISGVAPSDPSQVLFVSEACASSLDSTSKLLRRKVHQAIAFIFFHAWIWLLAVVALWQGSWPHIVTVLAGLLGAIAFGIVQVVKTSNLHKLFNALLDKGPCQGIDPLPGYWSSNIPVEAAIPVLDFVSLVALSFLAWKISKILNWQSFTKFGASRPVRIAHTLMMTFQVFLYLSSFYVLTFQAMWLQELGEPSSDPAAMMMENVPYRIFLGILTAFVIPWLFAGWYSVKYELKVLMALFVLFDLVLLGNMIFLLTNSYFKQCAREWNFLSFMGVQSTILVFVTVALSLACMFYYGKGMLHEREKNSNDRDLEKSGDRVSQFSFVATHSADEKPSLAPSPPRLADRGCKTASPAKNAQIAFPLPPSAFTVDSARKIEPTRVVQPMPSQTLTPPALSPRGDETNGAAKTYSTASLARSWKTDDDRTSLQHVLPPAPVAVSTPTRMNFDHLDMYTSDGVSDFANDSNEVMSTSGWTTSDDSTPSMDVGGRGEPRRSQDGVATSETGRDSRDRFSGTSSASEGEVERESRQSWRPDTPPRQDDAKDRTLGSRWSISSKTTDSLERSSSQGSR